MGLEAECTVRVGRKASEGVAQLEGDLLSFRGDFSLRIPVEEAKDLRVDGDALVVKTADQEVRFELGAIVADRWVRLIKEPKSLFEKLEVGPQSRVAVVDVADSLFLTALRERITSVAEGRVPEGAPVVFFGAETKDALRKVQLLRARMIDDGVLWIVRPKGSKAISEGDVDDVIKANGLVDTKVVSFSKTHTAHKCMIPVALRGMARVRPPIVSIPPSAPGPRPKKVVVKPAVKPAAKPAPKPAAKAKAKPAPKVKAKAKPVAKNKK